MDLFNPASFPKLLPPRLVPHAKSLRLTSVLIPTPNSLALTLSSRMMNRMFVGRMALGGRTTKPIYQLELLHGHLLSNCLRKALRRPFFFRVVSELQSMVCYSRS